MLKIGNFRYQRFLVAEIPAKVTPPPKLQVFAFKLTSMGLTNAFDLLRIYQIEANFARRAPISRSLDLSRNVRSLEWYYPAEKCGTNDDMTPVKGILKPNFRIPDRGA